MFLVALVALFVPQSSFAYTPKCNSNEGITGRFPKWPSTYDMRSSTIIQPCNKSGFLNASLYSQFGVVSVDWSNAKQLWVNPPMSCEEKLVEQAAALKAARPGVRVMGYRNIVKALPWFTSVRKAMEDPAKQDWFIPFNPRNTTPYHVPQCDNNYSPPKCSLLYHDTWQTPNYPSGDGNCPAPACDCGIHPCGEYLFNYLNASKNGLADFIVNEFILGPTLLGNKNLSGAYLDDEWYNYTRFPSGCSGSPVGGPTEEETHCLIDIGHDGDIGYTTAQTDAWCDVRHRAFDAAIAAGGWFWQMFMVFQTPSAKECAPVLRNLCKSGKSSSYYNSTTMHQLSGDHATLPNLMQDLATFLLLRGDFAFLGFGWSGCGFEVHFPEVLARDFGVPTSLCTESSTEPGVFTRQWTKADVTMNCNTYTGTIQMKNSAIMNID